MLASWLAGCRHFRVLAHNFLSDGLSEARQPSSIEFCVLFFLSLFSPSLFFSSLSCSHPTSRLYNMLKHPEIQGHQDNNRGPSLQAHPVYFDLACPLPQSILSEYPQPYLAFDPSIPLSAAGTAEPVLTTSEAAAAALLSHPHHLTPPTSALLTPIDVSASDFLPCAFPQSHDRLFFDPQPMMNSPAAQPFHVDKNIAQLEFSVTTNSVGYNEHLRGNNNSSGSVGDASSEGKLILSSQLKLIPDY